MGKLTGKVIVVSGASKGIGASIAENLAQEGASVIVNFAKSEQAATAVVERIVAGGGVAVALQADFSNPEEVRQLFGRVKREFGHVDGLVNNAGVYEFQPLESISEGHYDQIFGLNVKGLLFATQAAVEAFGEGGGTIINISSLAAVAALPNSSVYSATKAAVDSITRTLAAELGPRGILVNSVSPGPVETEGFEAMPAAEGIRELFTPQTPLRRIGKPEDIASVVSFLASDDARWITGQVISATGGLR
jgi:3-oxoacyl-[acyl-carrier protein] reductase